MADNEFSLGGEINVKVNAKITVDKDGAINAGEGYGQEFKKGFDKAVNSDTGAMPQMNPEVPVPKKKKATSKQQAPVSSDADDKAYEKSQQTAYRNMRKAYSEAERSYIAMQRAIVNGDNKGQEFFTKKQKSASTTYNNYYRRFQKDTTGLNAEQSKWASLPYTTQRDESLNVAKALSSMRSSAVSKGQALIDGVIKKEAEAGGGIVDVKTITNMQQALEKMKQAGDTQSLGKYFDTIKQSANGALDAIKSATDAMSEQKKIAQDMSKADETVNKINQEIGKNERSGKESSQELQDAKTAADAYNEVRDTGSLEKQRAAVDALEASWDKYKLAVQAAREEEKKQENLRNLTSGLAEAQRSLESLSDAQGGYSKWSSDLQEQYDTAAASAQRLQEALNDGNVTAANAEYENLCGTIGQLEQHFVSTNAEANAMGFALVDGAKKLLNIASGFAIFEKAKSYLSEMVQEITTIDTAMTELRKVTDETESTYDRFLTNASETAKEIGSSISDLVNTSSEFARMGYSISESADLGKTATIFSNVGDFSSVSDASDTLIAVMKGFQLSVDMADDIGDKLNSVANKYAVTAADIGEGLQNSASSLNVSGNTLDQSIAMLTTITEITQDAGGAGNALKILSLRLRGASTELESMGESTDGMVSSTSKLRDKIKTLTGGFDIMKDNSTFKSTYDIMLGISKEWDKMSDVDQSALLELIAGKSRSNQVTALLTNMSQAEEILKTSQGADGSMLTEHEKWLDSIEAKQQQLTASFQQLSLTVVNSDLVAGAYDAGNGLLGWLNSVIDEMGVLSPLLGTAATSVFSSLTGGNPLSVFFGSLGDTDKKYITRFNELVGKEGTAKALASVKEEANKAGESIGSLAEAMLTNSNNTAVATQGFEGFKTKLKGVGSVVGNVLKSVAANLVVGGVTTLISWGLSEIVQAIEYEANKAENLQKKWEEEREKLESLNTEQDDVTSELDSVNKQIADLENKLGTTGLTFVEQDELAKLKQTSAELELQNKILAEKIQLQKQSVIEAEGSTYNEKYGTGANGEKTTYDWFFKNDKGFHFGDSYDANDVYGHYSKREYDNAIGDYTVEQYAAEKFFEYTKDFEEIYGNNIDGFFKAKEQLLSMTQEEIDADPDRYAEMYSNYTAVTSKMFDQFESLWKAYEYFDLHPELKGGDTYKGVVSRLKLFEDDDLFSSYYNIAASNYIASQYAEDLKTITSGVQDGTITADNIGNYLSTEMEKAITTLFGNDGVKEWITDIITDNANSGGGKDVISSDNAVDTMKSRLTTAKTNAEFVSTIDYTQPISVENYEKLVAAGDDYAKCVQNINGTLQINRDLLEDAIESEYATLLGDVTDGLNNQKQAMVSNIAAIGRLVASLNNLDSTGLQDAMQQINQLSADIDENKEAILSYDILAAQIEYATSAYKKWVDAHDGAESGAQYDQSITAFGDLKEGYESGRVGTNEYRTAQEYLLGEGTYDVNKQKILERYLTDDVTGVVNFQRDLMQKGYLDSTGAIVSDKFDLEEMGKALGIGPELVKAMFMKANEYIADDTKKYQITNDDLGAQAWLQQYTDAENAWKAAYQAYRENPSDTTAYQTLLEATKAYNEISSTFGLGTITPENQDLMNTVTDATQQLVTALNNLTAAITNTNNGNSVSGSDTTDANTDEATQPTTQNNNAEESFDPNEPHESDGHVFSHGGYADEENSNIVWTAPNDTQTLNPVETENGLTVAENNWYLEKQKEEAARLARLAAEQGSEEPIEQDVEVTADTTQAEQAIDNLPDTITLTILAEDGSVEGTQSLEWPEGHAGGTDNAKGGLSLVDEEGAELIQHTDGTYEIGTNQGARLANLNEGDVVYTADETRGILGRLADIKGKRFASGNGGVSVSGSSSSGNDTPTLSKRYETLAGVASLLSDIDYDAPIAIEDYEKLVAAGDKYAACVQNINGVLRINYTLLNNQVMTDYTQLLTEAKDALKEEEEAYAVNIALLAAYTKQYKEGAMGVDEYTALSKELIESMQTNRQQISTYQALTANINYATSAYKKWVDAHNGKESGEQYDQSLLAYDDLKEGYESGRVGTNEYSAARKYLLGNNEYDADAERTLSRYLTDDGAGAANFQQDLIKHGFANANGSMMGGVTTQQIASEFGIGEELVRAMFMKMNEYIPEGQSKYKLNDKNDGENTDTEQNETWRQQAAAEVDTAYAAWSSDKSDANKQALIDAVSALRSANEDVVTFKVAADTTQFDAQIAEAVKERSVTVLVTYKNGNTVENTASDGTPVASNANGTDNANDGLSLVDEEGAELIQRGNGTYEIGTNKGPRLTRLDKGDAVYTAEETKGILSRLASTSGRRFADATASDGSGVKSKTRLTGTGKKSSKKINFDNLVDWIPTLLENLKRKTNDYIRIASKAIGYMLKNAEVNKAISSVRDELDYTSQAYERYIEQANAVAKQTKLSSDIIKKIQDGTIDITEYKKKVRENIEEYQKWWDKAVALEDTMDDLNDQLEELALQKLDNITDYFGNINDLIDANISAMQDAISVKQAYGEELKENDYKPMIAYAEQAVSNLVKYQDTLQKEFDTLVSAGDIQVGSDAWYEYSVNIRKVASEIADAKVQVSDLKDEMDNLVMTNLRTAYEYLQRIQASVESVGALNEAQNVTRSSQQYRTLISNGMKQIENLQMQNDELRNQMEGLDVLSEKYAELNSQLNDNQESIMSIKQNQEQWNDAIIDLKIDELQKQNDEFKQRLEIMDAIQEIEDAQQRRVSIYREGQGFVYEVDAQEVKDAQDNFEEAVNDLIINQLEATKELSNIYDSVGNQLVEVKDMLSGIDFTKYYSSVSAGVEDSTLLKDALSAIDAASIISNLATKDVSIDLSGMTLNNVNSVEELVDAIINQLPGYILQELHSKS